MAIINNGKPPGAPLPQANQGVRRVNQAGSGFTNLQKIVNANKSNQLGTKIAGGIGNQLNTASNTLNNSMQGFNQEIGKAKDTLEQNKLYANNTLNKVQTLGAANANEVGDEDFKKFGQIREGYKGPTAVPNTSNVQQQINNVKQLANNANTAQGRFGLLQRFVGQGKQYNAGQQRLDNLLLGQTGAKQFADSRRQAATLAQQAQNAQQGATESVKAVQGQYKGLVDELGNRIGGLDNDATAESEAAGMIGDLQTQVRNRTKQFSETEKGLYDRLQAQLKDPRNAVFDQDVIDRLGLATGQNLYNTNLLTVANPTFDPSMINEQRVANADEYAKYQALERLAGRNSTYLYDPSKAGTQQGVQVDRDGIAATVKQETDAFNNNTKRYADLANRYSNPEMRFANTFGRQFDANNINDLNSLFDHYQNYNGGAFYNMVANNDPTLYQDGIGWSAQDGTDWRTMFDVWDRYNNSQKDRRVGVTPLPKVE